jgi:hypothetical protein
MDESKALKLLSIAVKALGWNIAIPEVNEDADVPGLIIGKPEYIDWVLNCIGKKSLPIKLRKKSNE